MIEPSTPTPALRELYRRTLLDDVMPFWLRHGRDDRYGGIGNVIDDVGNPLGNDKFLWSQGRALWTFSALYNRVERHSQWLDFAHHIYRYIIGHGRDDRGRWMYRLDAAGDVLDRDTSIAVDGFVMNGLGEYYAATGVGAALDLALETQANIADRLARPGSYGLAPYELPAGLKNLGVAMLYSYFFHELGAIAGRPDICRQGAVLGDEILRDFYRPDRDALLEFVSLDGRFVDTPAGRACVPGHAIEALWMLMSVAERTGDTARIATSARLVRRHLEIAWDPLQGGLRLAIDIDGQEPVHWKRHDCKPWWVQVEALVATAYAHYPVPTGEWRQWLDRDGLPTTSAALPVKDPFHLPRALIVMLDLFGR